MGKVATSPLPSRDPHRFRAGGEIRSGPLVGKVATSPLPSHPHRFTAGGKIRSGPLVGKVATSPLPSRGSPPLHSGGKNQKWPTSGQSGYVTPAVSGIPTASELGGKIRSGPLVGKVATSPLPSRGSPPLQSGGENQKWPTSGQSGYVTPAVSGIPSAAERGGKSEVAHMWAKWLRHPCRLGDPHRRRAGGKITSGPTCGAKWLRHPCRLGGPDCFRAGAKSEVAHKWAKWLTSPLPSRGSPPLHSGGGNQKWPTCGQRGYVTPAVSGIPTAAKRGGEIKSGPLVGKVATSPLPSRGSPPLQSGGGNQKWPTNGQSGYVTPVKSEVAHKWAKWLRHPCRLGDPHRFRAGGQIRSGPLVGKVATSPLPSRGSPPLHSGGENQKWPTSGQSGYVTPAVSGIPTASELGGKSEVAHLWAKWLRHPCRLGDPHRFRAGGKIRSGQQVGKVATSPLPSRGSQVLQSGGGKSEVAHKWAKWLRHPCRLGDPHRCRAGGKSQVAHLWAKWLRHPCRLGGPDCFRAGAKSEVAHLWAKWLRHPCRLGDPHRCTAGGEIRSGPLVGKGATSPLPSRGSRPLQSGGGKSEVAHLWAKWLRHPCRLGDPHRFRAGGEIRSGPQMGKVATSPLPSRGSPPLQSGGGNHKWPTCGQSGYVTPAASGIPTAAQRGGKSEVAHKWAKWLHHPAVSGIPTASQRGGKLEVAHKWAKWLRHPCRLGDPHRCIAGGEIRSGPLVGKVATSPLPSRGSPPLQSGG